MKLPNNSKITDNPCFSIGLRSDAPFFRQSYFMGLRATLPPNNDFHASRHLIGKPLLVVVVVVLLTNTVVVSTAGGERGAVPAEPGRCSGRGEGLHRQRVSTTRSQHYSGWDCSAIRPTHQTEVKQLSD